MQAAGVSNSCHLNVRLNYSKMVNFIQYMTTNLSKTEHILALKGPMSKLKV